MRVRQKRRRRRSREGHSRDELPSVAILSEKKSTQK